jgi:thymidylate kinase
VGPDRCGKTTLANKTSQLLNIPYFKNYTQKDFFCTKIDPVQKIYIEGNLQLQLFSQLGISVIKDRDFPCEYAYSKAYGRKSDDEYIFSLDSAYAALQTLIIFCYKDSYKEYNDEYVNIDKIESIKKYYNEFLDKTRCKYLKLNTTDENLDNQLVLIQQAIQELKGS